MENKVVTKDHFADLRTQLLKIKEENKNIVFDYEKEEKEARSHVAKMRKSKTAISNLHKEKKKFFLEEGRKLDAAKNELIADVEEMIDIHAKPLQVIKDRKEAEIELERKRVEMGLDWDAAIAEDDLFNREREMKRKEAEQAQLEADRIAKEKAEQDEKDRIEYEAKVKADAEEKAKKDAEEALLKEQQEKERLIQEAKQREEQAKIDAENAEKQRLADIEAEKQRAEREKHEALAKQKREQEEKERAEVKRIADEKAEEERKSRNKNHQKAVNRKVVAKLMSVFTSDSDKVHISEAHAIEIVKELIKNPIPEISINY